MHWQCKLNVQQRVASALESFCIRIGLNNVSSSHFHKVTSVETLCFIQMYTIVPLVQLAPVPGKLIKLSPD